MKYRDKSESACALLGWVGEKSVFDRVSVSRTAGGVRTAPLAHCHMYVTHACVGKCVYDVLLYVLCVCVVLCTCEKSVFDRVSVRRTAGGV